MQARIATDLAIMTGICIAVGAMFALGVRFGFRRGKSITEL